MIWVCGVLLLCGCLLAPEEQTDDLVATSPSPADAGSTPEEMIKISAKVVRHAKYVTFQRAEVTVPRELFAAVLDRTRRLGVPPP